MDRLGVSPQYPGFGVTPDGRVKGPRGWRTPFVRPDGYVHIEGRLVHRMVALAWLGGPPTEKHEVSHINGDRSDNRVENLAWKTHKENEADKVLHGTVTRRGPNRKKVA